jgi:hypothetical protein
MPPANRDASELTRRRKAKALYSYNQDLKAAQTSAVGSVLREQPSAQMSDFVAQRKMGGCYCGANYDFFGPGGCGCRG